MQFIPAFPLAAGVAPPHPRSTPTGATPAKVARPDIMASAIARSARESPISVSNGGPTAAVPVFSGYGVDAVVQGKPADDVVARNLHALNLTASDMQSFSSAEEGIGSLSNASQEMGSFSMFPNETSAFSAFASMTPAYTAHGVPVVRGLQRNSDLGSFAGGLFNFDGGAPELCGNARDRPSFSTVAQEKPIFDAFAREMSNLRAITESLPNLNGAVNGGPHCSSEAAAVEMRKLSAMAEELRKHNLSKAPAAAATTVAGGAIVSTTAKPAANTQTGAAAGHRTGEFGTFAHELSPSPMAMQMRRFNEVAEEILNLRNLTKEMTEFNIAALQDPVYDPHAPRAEPPACLNPMCDEKHLISDCDITGPDEARVLTNAFFAREKAGQKKKRTRRRSRKNKNNVSGSE